MCYLGLSRRDNSITRRFIGIESHASESYYHSYTVATSGVHRLASQICHNRLFRKKLQQNILPMISTEVSSFAAHNTSSVHFVVVYNMFIILFSCYEHDPERRASMGEIIV
jgi:hypothetical protein